MAAMTRQQALDVLEQEYQIQGADIYLLELIPLVEMIWADGVAQDGEIDVMRQFVLAHQKNLAEAAGFEIVTQADIERFFNRFCQVKPASGMLKAIRELSLSVILSSSDAAANQEKSELLLGYCMDIAAATVLEYPYGLRERIIEQEKKMLLEIIRHLHRATSRP